MLRAVFLVIIGLAPAAVPELRAQGNYEVQVYGSELTPPRSTVFEFHSNFTGKGERSIVDGVLPTYRAFHETLEITHGFNEWFETGLYLFQSYQPGRGLMFVGTHLRPRFSVPERFHLPVGISFSNEIGYQRPSFSADTWTWECRPIIDKKLGRWYGSFNPTIERSFHGPGIRRGVEFSPNGKVSFAIVKRAALGVEYYGALGPLRGFDRLREQQHLIIPVIDLDLGPRWEFNFGVGMGVTSSTDRLLVKMIVGYRFGGK